MWKTVHRESGNIYHIIGSNFATCRLADEQIASRQLLDFSSKPSDRAKHFTKAASKPNNLSIEQGHFVEFSGSMIFITVNWGNFGQQGNFGQ